MTPKEKAKELTDKYTMYQNGYGYEYKVKQCALIAVDEILGYLESDGFPLEIEYWQEVKKEIINI